MKTKPCKCCSDNKPAVRNTSDGYGYNRLKGEAREWAADNKFARSEFCVRVKGGKKFSGEEWQAIKCGDGRMGFSSRRKGHTEAKMEMGLDGQYKKKRRTLVNPRSARASASRTPRRVDGSRISLASSVTIFESQRDPVVVAQQRKEHKKIGRAKNRNNGARRGHKKIKRRAVC